MAEINKYYNTKKSGRNIGEDVEKEEPLLTAGGCTNSWDHHGNLLGGSSEHFK